MVMLEYELKQEPSSWTTNDKKYVKIYVLKIQGNKRFYKKFVG